MSNRKQRKSKQQKLRQTLLLLRPLPQESLLYPPAFRFFNAPEQWTLQKGLS